jgi:hypothetical protein
MRGFLIVIVFAALAAIVFSVATAGTIFFSGDGWMPLAGILPPLLGLGPLLFA